MNYRCSCGHFFAEYVRNVAPVKCPNCHKENPLDLSEETVAARKQALNALYLKRKLSN